MKLLNLFFIMLISMLFVLNCSQYNEEDKAYVETIEDRRDITNEWMRDDPNSPFNFKGKIEFEGLNYFDVDPGMRFESKLVKYEESDSIKIIGTKGEERLAFRIGYLPFTVNDIEYKLNMYQNVGSDGSIYYSVWFTDRTTNYQTYGVGRYLPVKYVDDPNHIYKIDFNLAYNPYCAYNSDYSCAIPTKEDFIDLAIYAGEKKYYE